MKSAEEIAMAKAKNQKESRNLTGAMETLENYLKTDPHNTRPRLMLAQLAILTKNTDYGIFQLDIILDLEPENLEARKALVTVLKQKSKYTKESMMHFDYLVAHEPDNPDLWNSYAIFSKLQLTDYEKSDECYRRAISLDPKNSDYHLNYAILLVNDLKRYDDGKRELELAVETDPTNQRAKDALSNLLKKKYGENGAVKKGFLSRIKLR